MTWEDILKKQFDYSMLRFKEDPNVETYGDPYTVYRATYGDEPNKYSILVFDDKTVGGNNSVDILDPMNELMYTRGYQKRKGRGLQEVPDEIIRSVESIINSEINRR
tara:strand:+ start:153 stop:473 length:321 start_codon:yes stop_codon:yes gene_type:complete